MWLEILSSSGCFYNLTEQPILIQGLESKNASSELLKMVWKVLESPAGVWLAQINHMDEIIFFLY